jgi:hypothetical protein
MELIIMTPSQIESLARAKYNSAGSTFWSESEIMDYITQASIELSLETHCIQRVFTTTTVASQAEYDWPTNAISIKRITYDGKKLMPITFREDDALTLNNQSTTATGTPQYYTNYNEVFSLRPIPDSALTLKVYAACEAQTIDSSSTLEIPTAFHLDIVDFVVSEMASKDQNWDTADRFRDKWDQAKIRAKRHMRKMMRGDAFVAVQDEESLPTTILGGL